MWQISPHQAIDVVQDIKQVILLWTEILQKNEHRIVQKNAIPAMILFQQSSSFMCT